MGFIRTESSNCFELLWIRFGSYQIKRKGGHCSPIWTDCCVFKIFLAHFTITILLCLDSDLKKQDFPSFMATKEAFMLCNEWVCCCVYTTLV